MENSSLNPVALQPPLSVEVIRPSVWKVDNTHTVSLEDGYYTCSCTGSVDDLPPWQECEHVYSVRQYELEQLEIQLSGANARAFADRLLWEIGHLEREMEEINNSAHHQFERIRIWQEHQTGRLEGQINAKSELLRAYMLSRGVKTESLVNGTLKIRKQQPAITIDKDAFDFSQDAFIRIIPEKREPDMRAIRKHFNDTGEVLTGMGVEFREDKLTIETNKTERKIHGNITPNALGSASTPAA